jgi:hypothetical protein
LWSASLGRLKRIMYDAELLYVASMLHDLGLVPAFDNHLAPFEDAGGDVGWVFGAGAGWPAERRDRVKEIIVRHMWHEVDPALDGEGHLLREGTALDISGRNVDTWPADFRAEVLRRCPRLTLVTEFTAAFEDQAPASPAARPPPPSRRASAHDWPVTHSTSGRGWPRSRLARDSMQRPFAASLNDPAARRRHVVRAHHGCAARVVDDVPGQASSRASCCTRATATNS